MTENKTSHTPGPWSAGPPAWFRGQRTPEDGKRPITAGAAGVVANVYGAANAQLIAAAPDLRAALEALLNWGDKREEELYPDVYKPWAEARALLARIDGAAR
jgi:hypothetical protein